MDSERARRRRIAGLIAVGGGLAIVLAVIALQPLSSDRSVASATLAPSTSLAPSAAAANRPSATVAPPTPAVSPTTVSTASEAWVSHLPDPCTVLSTSDLVALAGRHPQAGANHVEDGVVSCSWIVSTAFLRRPAKMIDVDILETDGDVVYARRAFDDARILATQHSGTVARGLGDRAMTVRGFGKGSDGWATSVYRCCGAYKSDGPAVAMIRVQSGTLVFSIAVTNAPGPLGRWTAQTRAALPDDRELERAARAVLRRAGSAKG